MSADILTIENKDERLERHMSQHVRVTAFCGGQFSIVLHMDSQYMPLTDKQARVLARVLIGRADGKRKYSATGRHREEIV